MSTTEPVVRRWTRDEYYRMGDAGLFLGERVQLVGGQIYRMSPQSFLHAATVDHVADLFKRRLGQRAWVRQQLPLALSDDSEPEPDISVVYGLPADFDDHPRTAELVIEASLTTLAFDRREKAGLYASAVIEDYWIVNLQDGQVEVRRQPIADAAHPFGWRDASIAILSHDERVSPLAFPDIELTAAKLFPPGRG